MANETQHQRRRRTAGLDGVRIRLTFEDGVVLEKLAGTRGREDTPGQQEGDGRANDEGHEGQAQRHGKSQDPVEDAV